VNKLSQFLGAAAVVIIALVFVLQFRPASDTALTSKGPSCAVEIQGDCIPTTHFYAAYRLLAPRGCLVNYGQLSGALPDVDLGQLMEAGSIFVTKYGPRAGVVRPEHVAAFVSEALALAIARPLASDVAARLPLNRVADAYRVLDSGVPGKVLVLPNLEE